MPRKKKICSHCHQEKSINGFGKNKSENDGYQHNCKICRAKQNKAYRQKNSKKISEIEKNYRNTGKGKLARKKYKINNPEKIKKIERKSTKKCRKNNPEKFRARNAANKAAIRGKLKKMPCEICGKFPAEKHHNEYSKPLEIVWLCKKHHVEFHRNQKMPKEAE